MNSWIEELRQWGCNTEDALSRMLGDEDFYRECLLDIVADPCFEKLEQALHMHTVRQGFEAAHTLKGVLANMGLTPMYETIVEIVEPLRAGSDEGMMMKYEELQRQRLRLEQILEASAAGR